jgi:hypothetical protein
MLVNRQPPPGRNWPTPPARSGVAIRDAVFNFFLPLRPSMFATLRKVPMPSLQPNQLPGISVYELAEDAPSLGLPNMGPTAYKNDTTIGISVCRGFEDPIYLQGGLESDVQFIKTMLLTNAQFTRRWYGALFESVPSYRTRYVYATEGEAYFGELRLEMTFRFPESFPVEVTDTLQEIDLTIDYDSQSGIDIRAKYALWLQQCGVTP